MSVKTKKLPFNLGERTIIQERYKYGYDLREIANENEIWFFNIKEFNEKMLEWILWYNLKRYHWSLNL